MNAANKNALNPRLSIQEQSLNDAEKKVLHAFRDGWKEKNSTAPHIVSLGGGASQKLAEEPLQKDWQNAIIRGEFLRDLFLENYCELDPREILISRAWIEGKLDLSHCESRLPISFANCVFPVGIWLVSASIPSLMLTKCYIYDAKSVGRKNAAINAMHVKVTTSVFLNEGFRSKGAVRLDGANVGGQLSCRGGHFENGLSAQSMKVGKTVFLSEGFITDAEVRMDGADIGEHLICKNGRFEKELNAQDLKTGGDIFLDEKFEANESVCLDGADIGGQLGCRGGNFNKGLGAQGMKISKTAFFDKGFEAKDKVCLDGVDIGGQLNCRGGNFQGGLYAQSMNIGESAFLDKGFHASGDVWVGGASVGGQLNCRGGHFEGDFGAPNLNTGSDVFLHKGHVKGEMSLNGANIGGQLNCRGGQFENGFKVMYASVKSAFLLDGANIKGHVFLDGTEVGGEFRNMQNWSSENTCSADGFRYQKIKNNDDSDNDWKAGLDWLRHLQKSSAGNFSPQPYQQLMNVYRSMGHTNWARKIGFELEKSRSRKFKGIRLLLWRIWYAILWAAIGYGYKPFRFLGCAMVLLAFGWFVFSIGHDGIISLPDKATPAFLENEWIPSDVEAQIYRATNQENEAVRYPPFNPLVYSLEAVFPVLSLGQLEQWHPSNGWIRGVRYSLTIIGSVLLAILALFGVGVLGPRWKSDDDSG